MRHYWLIADAHKQLFKLSNQQVCAEIANKHDEETEKICKKHLIIHIITLTQ